MAVGAVIRIVQALGHGFLDPVRDGVLDLVGLAVDLEPGHTELVDQKALHQAVAAQDRVGQSATLRREQDRPTLFPC